MADFKDRLNEALEMRNMKPADLSKKTGIGEGAISQYRKGAYRAKQWNIDKMARALNVSPSWLMGTSDSPRGNDSTHRITLPPNAIPYTESHIAPILGIIPAGYPVLAVEDIEGYAPIPYPDEEHYFFLRVHGTSMIGAGIKDGDLVLIRLQDCADDGQIVAARVNGDEATLKRYKLQGDTVILLPENPDFDPQIVPVSDFNTGYAQIIGVAIEVRHNL